VDLVTPSWGLGHVRQECEPRKFESGAKAAPHDAALGPQRMAQEDACASCSSAVALGRGRSPTPPGAA
jgi:hypothetical protein